MSSTSQKHRDFIGEPMGQKSVRDIAGIGPVLGKRFEDKGYDKVSPILCLKSLLVGNIKNIFV